MARTFFFAAGMFILSWGGTFLVVDKLVLNITAPSDNPKQDDFRGIFTSTNDDKRRVFDPPEWVAFTLISFGAMTVLYSAALPHKA